MKSSVSNAKILGVSCVIPKNSLSLYDEPNLYEGNQKKIKRVVESSGFLNRRVVDEGVTSSDLCFRAAEDLLSHINVKKEEIDAILFISYTGDYLMPATSYVLHNRLGLSETCLCMDIPQACSGYEFGLYQAAMLVDNGCRNVLLCVGDTFSKFTDMFRNNTAPVFGDAGTETLITRDESTKPWKFSFNTDSTGYDALICKNGGFRQPFTKDMFYEDGKPMYLAGMDGARVFDFTMKRVQSSVSEMLEYANEKPENMDFFIMHQANKMILQNIALALGVSSEKMPIGTMTEYGNQCGASIPCTFSYMVRDSLQKNDNHVLLSGFGVGLSWANCILDINKIYCSELIEY